MPGAIGGVLVVIRQVKLCCKRLTERSLAAAQRCHLISTRRRVHLLMTKILMLRVSSTNRMLQLNLFEEEGGEDLSHPFPLVLHASPISPDLCVHFWCGQGQVWSLNVCAASNVEGGKRCSSRDDDHPHPSSRSPTLAW